MSVLNAMSVDVEDYFQVNAFAKVVDRAQWDAYSLRVGDNTRRVLDLLDEYQVTATFFVLGWVAEREPGLVRDIDARGHEVASHGFGHELVYVIGPKRFREDVRRSKQILEETTGRPVLGYRAPSYSITANSLWALDILIEEGFTFDSSIFPVHHDTYGIPGAPPLPHIIERRSGTITEFPLTTWPLRVLGRQLRLPVAGGGYLRLLPVRFLARTFRKINTVECNPIVLYFHPWEIDPAQPRIRAGIKSRFRHYLNLSRTEAKLRHLLSSLAFGTMDEVLQRFFSCNGAVPSRLEVAMSLSG